MRNIDSILRQERLPLDGRKSFSAVILIVALSLTLTISAVLYAWVEKSDAQRLSVMIDEVRARIEQRLDSNAALLRGAAGMVAAQGVRDRGAFHLYVQQLQLRERHPEIQEIGWSMCVPALGADALLGWFRDQGLPMVNLWPPTTRADRQAIALIEPVHSTESSHFGFDLTSQATHKMAMESAFKSKQAIATGPTSIIFNVKMDREDGKKIKLQNKKVLFLYYPVSIENVGVADGNRSEMLRGYVYTVLSSEILLKNLITPDKKDLISLTLSDVGPEDVSTGTLGHPGWDRHGSFLKINNESEMVVVDDNMLYRTDVSPEQFPDARYSTSQTFAIAGRLWFLNSCSTSTFENQSQRLWVVWVFGVGIVMSFAIFEFSRSHARRVVAREKIYRQGIVGQRAAEINLRICERIVSGQNLQEIIQLVVDGGRELTGASIGTFVVPSSNNLQVQLVSAVSEKSSCNEVSSPMTGVNGLLAATIDDDQVIRLNDVRLDVRYKNGHSYLNSKDKKSSVVSYLAVPVHSRTNKILGGLYFTHPEPGHFTDDYERLLLGLAAQASIAIDNAELFRSESIARQTAAKRSDQLVRANAELQQFAYVSSHDLQEPLRTVTQYLDLLRRRHGSKLDSQAQRYIEYASESASRMYSLLNDLLTYSRIGRFAAREHVSLRNVFEEVCKDLEVQIADAKSKIIYSDLPTIFCERSKIRLVIENLLTNAIKFRGHADLLCQISAERDESGTWTITIADNGIGISPEHHTIIFEVFEKLHDVERFPGTGIGLAICRKVMEQHGGRIWVQSILGAGSQFRFTLPENGNYAHAAAGSQYIDNPTVTHSKECVR